MRHIPELDGVRGLAILLVVLFHLKIPGMQMGWSGVDLFFVLSGFLITSILLATRGSANYFSAFYARRVLRIFPLYFFILFVVFLVVLPVADRYSLAHRAPIGDQLWYWLYASNWFNALGHNIFYLSHFWSLAVEEQFYLIWPLLVFVFGSKLLGKTCLALIVGCFLLRVAFSINHPNTLLVQRATVFRIDALALGGLIAVLVATRGLVEKLSPYFRFAGVVSALALAIIVGLKGSAQSAPMMTVGYASLEFMAAYLVLFAVTHSGSSALAARVLRFDALRALGKYSYGLYVLHYPIIVFVFAAEERLKSNSPRLVHIASVLLAAVASYMAALLSWALLEKPILRLKDNFRYGLGKRGTKLLQSTEFVISR